MDQTRCDWATGNPLYEAYHDGEWGVPSHDDRHLFEMLILEGAQAGLSWITVLKKRENYRRAYHEFDAERIAGYTQSDVDRLLADEGIVRNRAKVQASILNAKAFLQLRDKHGSFDRFIWQFVEGRPVQNNFQTLADLPAKTPESDAMSKALLSHGFKFVGSTICYAYMQAVGMVNDHLVTCPRHAHCRDLATES